MTDVSLGKLTTDLAIAIGKDIKNIQHQNAELDFILETLHGAAYYSVKDEWAYRCKVAEVVGCKPREVGTSTCMQLIREQLVKFGLHRTKINHHQHMGGE